MLKSTISPNLDLSKEMIANSKGVGHDRQRRIHRSTGWKETSIHNVKIVEFVRFAIFIQSRCFRIAAETDRAVLMGHAGQRDAVSDKQVSREQALMTFMAVDTAFRLLPH